MKKSRIILPAIALLAVSGIASVTGTVAWFTASNSASFSATNIAAISTEGNLKAQITAKKGTKEYTANNNTDKQLANTVSTLSFEYLTDVSYDVLQPQFYDAVTDVVTSEKENADSGEMETVTEVETVEYVEVSNKIVSTYKTGTGESAVTNNVWYAAEFSVTFSTEASYGNYDLFFDGRAAYSSLTENSDSDIAAALRISMKCGDEVFVWAPANENDEITRVTSAGKTSGEGAEGDVEAYDEENAVIGDYNQHFTSSSAKADATDDVTHLASGLSATTTKTVEFVVWFEGTDPECIAENASNANATVTAMAAKLSFYTVSWSD